MGIPSAKTANSLGSCASELCKGGSKRMRTSRAGVVPMFRTASITTMPWNSKSTITYGRVWVLPHLPTLSHLQPHQDTGDRRDNECADLTECSPLGRSPMPQVHTANLAIAADTSRRATDGSGCILASPMTRATGTASRAFRRCGRGVRRWERPPSAKGPKGTSTCIMMSSRFGSVDDSFTEAGLSVVPGHPWERRYHRWYALG